MNRRIKQLFFLLHHFLILWIIWSVNFILFLILYWSSLFFLSDLFNKWSCHWLPCSIWQIYKILWFCHFKFLIRSLLNIEISSKFFHAYGFIWFNQWIWDFIPDLCFSFDRIDYFLLSGLNSWVYFQNSHKMTKIVFFSELFKNSTFMSIFFQDSINS